MKILISICFALVLITSVNAQWTSMNGPSGSFVSAMDTDDSIIVAFFSPGFLDGKLYLSQDYGDNWLHLALYPSANVYDVELIGQTIYATSGNFLYISPDMGMTWNTGSGLPGISVYSVCVIDSTILVGTGNGLYRSVDYGVNFTKCTIGITDTIFGQIKHDGNKIYAVGSENIYTYDALYRSIDNGISWAKIYQPQYNIYDLLISNDSIYMIMGNKMAYSYNGIWFTQINAVNQYSLFSYGGNIYSPNSTGIKLFNPGTNSWNNIIPGNFSLVFQGGPYLYCSNYDGLYRSSGLPYFKELICNGINNTIINTIAFHNNTIFVGCYDRNCNYYNSSTSTWEQFSTGLNSAYTGIVTAFTSIGNIKIAGTNFEGIKVYNDSAAQWKNSFGSGGGRISDLLVKDSVAYASGNFSGTALLLMSNDSGLHWVEMDSGINSSTYVTQLSKLDTSLFIASNRGIFRYDPSVMMWKKKNNGFSHISPNIVALGENNDVLYAAPYNNSNQFFKSSDMGENWVLTGTGWPSAIRCYDLAFYNNTIIAASDSGAYLSNDEGATWIAINQGLPEIKRCRTIAVKGIKAYLGTEGYGVYEAIVPNWLPMSVVIDSIYPDCGNASGAAYVTAYGGTPPYSYSWNTNPAQTTSSITNQSYGNYIVTVADSSGTTVIDTIYIPHSVPAATITASGSLQFCSGDSVILLANNGSSYLWSNGLTTSSITIYTSGTYSVVVTDSMGCSALSLPVTVSMLSAQPPVISQSGNVLESSLAYSYQWYLNGMEILGANLQQFEPALTGIYSVMITDTIGCTAISAPFNFIISDINEDIIKRMISIYPNPSMNTFNIETILPGNYDLVLEDITGRMVARWINFDASSRLEIGNKLEKGIYLANLFYEGVKNTFHLVKY